MSRDPIPYVDPRAPRGPIYRAFAWFSGLRVTGVFSRLVMWRLDPLVMRASGGRIRLAGLIRTALLETRGARTGQPRANAVIYFHDGERVTIIASRLGDPRNPGWYYNLRAHPDVVFGGQPFTAEEVGDEAERQRLFALGDRVFPAYAMYRERAARAGRTIPIVQLVPRTIRP